MRRWFARSIDRAIAWRKERRWPEQLALYREMERWDPERLAAWRWDKLKRLIVHAHETVPYWREVFERLGATPDDLTQPEHLRLLPPLSKDLINQHGDLLLSSDPARGKLTFGSTGGSTGKNVWFLLDATTHDHRRAAGRLTEEWDGVVPGTRLATLWGAALDTAPSRAAVWYDRLTSRLFLSAYGVDNNTLDEYFRRLDRFRPEVLSSYPSILLHAARYVGRERCRRLGVRLIYTSAEALYEPVREELQELFGCPVRNRYASREFGMIGSDCPEGHGLHLMDMRLWIETIPPNAVDQPGELVITDLDNYPMPLLRYKIEDTGRVAVGPCPCGRAWSRLSAVDGRVLDVIITPSGRAFGGTFFTLTLRPFDRSIQQFQVVQDRLDHLTIKIVPGHAWEAEKRAQLLQLLQKQLGREMQIDLIPVESIPPLKSGKRRFVVSEIPADQRVAP